MELFPDLQALAESGYIFRITDNGGKTCDRYTVVLSDGDYLGMSGIPEHPQGFSQWGERIDLRFQHEQVEADTEVDLALGDLPDHYNRPGYSLAEHVRRRINEAWRDALQAIARGEVAKTREDALVHYGLHDDGGKGIYFDGAGKYWVRTDNGDWKLSQEGSVEDADFGPYDTAAEVLRATLPDEGTLSNDECSTLDVRRLEPDPEVLAKVKALEAMVDEAYEKEHS